MESEWRSEHIRANGVRLHVVSAGPTSGDAVLLLHGFPETWRAWRKHLDALAAAGLRVIAPDLRGYGQSEAPPRTAAYRIDTVAGDIAALADAVAAPRITLAGHDWGGIVAWAVAARHPERVARLVVVNAPHPDLLPGLLRPSHVLRSAHIGLFQLPWLAEAALKARDFALLRRALVATSRAGTFTPAELDRYAADWTRAGRLRGMLNYYRALVRSRPPAFGRIAPPTVILWGRRDLVLHPRLGEASLEHCSDGRLQAFDAATHWLHLEEPDAVLRAIRDSG